MDYTKKFTTTVALLLLCVTQLFAAEKFNYKMAESTESDSANSFYQPPDSAETLENIPGGQVHNVIYCIGDGMGINHVALTRHQALGPDKKLHMERLPIVGLVKTYSASSLITDSAAAGTALACGIKTKNGMIGMNPEKESYYSVLELLSEQGYRTGLVSTSAITHATPAVFSSHVLGRNMQIEIALQQLDTRVDVLFGGGRKFFLPAGVEKGLRQDGRNLFQEAAQTGYQLADTKEEMLAIDQLPAIGLFADEGMTTFDPEPSLQEMTRTAIKLLAQKDKGAFFKKPHFFLMVEGSQIDWAAHANDTDRVVRQTLLFDMAVKEAIDFARRDRHTLVIVTADHETGGLVIETETLNDQKIDPDWEETGHTAADVPIYAFGPGSEYFAGVMDNTEIPKRIAELTGLKEFPKQRIMIAETVPSK